MPCGLHPSSGGEARDVFGIDLTPDALRSPRCEALQKRLGVERLSDAVDPAPAQRDIERLCVRDRRFARLLLEDADPNLVIARVMHAHPRLKRRFSLEALDP